MRVVTIASFELLPGESREFSSAEGEILRCVTPFKGEDALCIPHKRGRSNKSLM
jgi:hypothetical protein